MEIENVEKLHEMGYGLKDAKTTLSQDIKFNVAQVKIEGSTGEVLNLPRWIGKIIENNKIGKLDSHDMINELKQTL